MLPLPYKLAKLFLRFTCCCVDWHCMLYVLWPHFEVRSFNSYACVTNFGSFRQCSWSKYGILGAEVRTDRMVASMSNADISLVVETPRESHKISPYLTESCQFLPNIKSHQISESHKNLTISHWISHRIAPNLTIFHQIAEYCQILWSLAKSHHTSPHLFISHKISPYLANCTKSHYISQNLTILH